MKRFDKIYVASSWSNERYPSVVDALKSWGCNVFDFRNPGTAAGGFHWSQATDEPQPWGFDFYRRVLARPASQNAFRADMGALRRCDVCVVVMPCGRSAHLEAGYACGAGKLVIFLWEDIIDKADLMSLMADYHVKSIEALRRIIDLKETNNL